MREKLYYTLKVTFGKVAERLKALVLKTSEVLKPPWVRIPPFPPIYKYTKDTESALSYDIITTVRTLAMSRVLFVFSLKCKKCYILKLINI